jgi:predicted aspartyl protease
MPTRFSSSSAATCLALAFVFELSFTGPAASQISNARTRRETASPHVLPLEIPRGTLIAVRGAIGELSDLRLLLDTGAFRTVIDRRIAAELGLRGTASRMEIFGQHLPAERVSLPPLRLGPIQADGVSALTADLTELGSRLGWQPDAIVGLDVLRGQCFSVDYRARRLTFACTTAWSWQVTCEPQSQLVIVTVIINGRNHRLLVDTGSDAVAVFARAAAHLAGDEDGRVRADTLAGSVELRRIIARTIEMGGMLRRGHPIFVLPTADQDLGYDGVLGTGWLGARIQLDLNRMVVSWSE